MMVKSIKLLSLDRDLKPITDQKLAVIMMEACAVYNEYSHSNPKKKKDAWIRVEHVAEEITKRKNIKKEP